jgi:hypothetical protein
MKKRIIASALALSFAVPCAFAQDAVRISGFGTGALTWTNTDKAEFARPNQASGADKDVTTGVDSNFGVQADYAVNSWLSVTGQGLVRKDAQDDFGAELAWAFAKAKVSDDVAIRVGRMGVPAFMISDYRNVGYANTMLRPPAEVYRQVNADSFDGADLVYQDTFGDTTVTAQFGVGRTTSKQPGGVEVVFKPLTALHVIAENGPNTFRFGRADAKFSVENNPTLAVTDIRGSFTSIGYTLDYKNFLVQSEYALRKTESRTVMDTTSYYVMLGYRIGKVTPYYYYGNIKQDTARTYAGLPTTGPLAPLTAGVNAVVKSALQSNNAVGVRWDFAKSAALKVQVDRISPRDGAGAFINVKPGFSGPVTVYAAGIDFVF